MTSDLPRRCLWMSSCPMMPWCPGSVKGVFVSGGDHTSIRESSAATRNFPLSKNVCILHSILKKEPVELSSKSLIPKMLYWRNILWPQNIEQCLPDCKTATLFPVSSQILTVVLREEEIFISWDWLGKVWQVSDSHCSIKVLLDVRVEEEMALHPPVQADWDDPFLMDTEVSDDVLPSSPTL